MDHTVHGQMMIARVIQEFLPVGTQFRQGFCQLILNIFPSLTQRQHIFQNRVG